MRIKKQVLLSILSLTAIAGAAHAEELTGTLKKIKTSGAITIGHRDSAFPFSYLDGQTPVGFTMDLCAQVVDSIKKSLSLPELKVNYVAVSPSNRIPQVVSGAVDLECGSTTVTKERSQQVNFSNITFISNTKILARVDSGVKTSDDLKDKRIAVLQGASNNVDLTKLDVQKGLKIQYVKAHDSTDAFKLLEEKKVDGFVYDDIQLAIWAAKSSTPKAYTLLSNSLGASPYAIMLKKDDKQLEQIVNSTLASLNTSGEYNKIYAKWFVTSQFKFPMDDALKNQLKNPNNTPVE